MSLETSITVFGSIVGTIACGVIVRLLAEDAKDWAPKVNDRLLTIAVKRLPESVRDRCAEEWKAHVADIPGVLGKLAFTLDLQRASLHAQMSERERDTKKRWIAWHAELSGAVSPLVAAVRELELRRTAGLSVPHDAILKTFENSGLDQILARKPRPNLSPTGFVIGVLEVRYGIVKLPYSVLRLLRIW